MTTQIKFDQLEKIVGARALGGTVGCKCWTLLNKGCSVDRLASMVSAGTLVETPWSLIPLEEVSS